MNERLERYLVMIDEERQCHPAEGMLADEIWRLRRVIAGMERRRRDCTCEYTG